MFKKHKTVENRYFFLSNLGSLTSSLLIAATLEQYFELERMSQGHGPYSESTKGFLIFGLMSFLYLPSNFIWKRLLQMSYAYGAGLPGSSKTKLIDYLKVRKIESELKNLPPPEIHPKGIAFGDDYLVGAVSKDFSTFSIYNEDLEKPGKLAELGIHLLRAQKYSEGLEYVIKSFDLLDKRIVENNKATKGYRKRLLRELKIDKFLHIKDPEPCLELAIFNVFNNPKKAWYYSELAKKLADKFVPTKRKQAYLLSSLIAASQQRDDEKKQWEETVKVLHEEPEWERLGESRTIVKRCSLDDFFKNSIVIKQSKNRDELIHEAGMLKLAKQIIPEIKTPEVLYVSKDPIDDFYSLVMRFERGNKTLYEILIEKPDTKLEPFLHATCEILQKIKNDFPQQDLRDKIRKKLKSPLLKLPEELSDSIINRLEIIIKDLEKTPYGYKKDSISQNIYVLDRQVGVFDFEGEERVPKLFELANFLFYPLNPPIINFEKLAMLFKEFSAEKGSYSEAAYFLNFHQAIIYRSICFLESSSLPDKKYLNSKRKTILDNISSSLNHIIENEGLSKSKKDGYKYLLDDFNKLEKHLDSYIS